MRFQDAANEALAMHEQEFCSRPLQVHLSSPQGGKRSATTIVSKVGNSQEASAEANGGKSSSDEADVPAGERAARTLGLMNVPDTVNDARVRALVEPYGKLIKVVLRPDHQGAIVEFAEVHAAGKASLELEGQEIAPGRPLHVGTVPEMLKQSAEKKTSRATQPNQSKQKSTGFLAPPTGIRRPQQSHGGRRGGLGVKRGGASALQSRNESAEGNGEKTTTSTQNTTDAAPPSEGGSTKKSNDDFRAMLQRSQPK